MSCKNKSQYKNFQHKKKRLHQLEPGLKGFLCTCNSKFKEKDCLREAYNILNEYADKLFGTEENNEKINILASSEIKQENTDQIIEDTLENEIASLKADLQKKPCERRFQAVESGANGIVFIRTTIPDPVKLTHYIVKALSNEQKSKFLLRLLPVEMTCKAYIDDICTACEPLFEKYFSHEKTYAIIFNHRNNDRLKRDEVIEKLANMIAEKNEKNKTDLKHPQLAVLVEVIRSICCISVVPEFYLLRKYNLIELFTRNHDSLKNEIQANKEKSDS